MIGKSRGFTGIDGNLGALPHAPVGASGVLPVDPYIDTGVRLHALKPGGVLFPLYGPR